MSARADIRLDERREAAVAWCLRLADGPLDEAGRDAFQAWLDSDMATPLPPLDGSMRTPVLEIAGARLEGVSVEVDDPTVEPAGND